MCGITGGFYLKNKADLDRLKNATDCISHRGPDGEGHFIDENIGLGHRRLSIIDLKGGAQPMHSKDERFIIVFNGEIYNFPEIRLELINKGFRFSTNSDTEVILSAYSVYGKDCLNKFNGIFSFCIYDRHEKSFFIARDQLGVKPLYYYYNEDGFFFGSEIKTLFKLTNIDKQIENEALDYWLTYRHTPSPLTLFKGIYKLSPGHYLTFKNKKLEFYRYWAPKPEVKNLTFAESVAQYQTGLETAVERQMISDVPVGLMLSGGIDSALIGALMSKKTKGFKSFTIGFEEQGEHNELKEAKYAAKFLGTDHHEIVISNNDFNDFFNKSFYFLEEPIATSSASAIYPICRLANSNNIKVLLCGQGADEPNAGYSRHLAEKYSSLLRMVTKTLLIKSILRHSSNEKVRRALFAMGETDPLRRLTNVYSIFTEEMKNEILINRNKVFDPGKVIEKFYKEVKHLDDLSRILYIDARNDLPDNLLLLADKMSMAASIELRVPFLDIELFSFLESVPSSYKIKRLTTKYLHKQMASKWLPKEIINRKKKGFNTPIDIWFKQNIGKIIKEELTDPGSACSKYFNVHSISKFVDEHQVGKHDYKRNIFALWSFEKWYNNFYLKM